MLISRRVSSRARAFRLLCERPSRKKERKKTDNPREGWEDGTPPPHRDFKERCVVRYPSPTLGSLPLPISLRSLSPILAATFMPPRGRPTLVVLSLVTSSSDALFSSASSCDAAACRSRDLLSLFWCLLHLAFAYTSPRQLPPGCPEPSLRPRTSSYPGAAAVHDGGPQSSSSC